jgi:hypothetical protein
MKIMKLRPALFLSWAVKIGSVWQIIFEAELNFVKWSEEHGPMPKANLAHVGLKDMGRLDQADLNSTQIWRESCQTHFGHF